VDWYVSSAYKDVEGRFIVSFIPERLAVRTDSGVNAFDGIKVFKGVRDGFWKDFRGRGLRPYGDSELIAAYSGEDKAKYARDGVVILALEWKVSASTLFDGEKSRK